MPSRTLLIVLSLGLSACDSGNPSDLTPPLGTFTESRVQITVGGQPFAVGLPYVQRTLAFDADGTLRARVASDIPDENGTAQGTWDVSDDDLRLRFTASTTAYYPVGQTVTEAFETVGADYRLVLRTGDDPETFTGPGLLLVQEQPDENDADGDGNRRETVATRFLFKRNDAAPL